MQTPLPPEDDGLIVMQRLTPDQFDVVLGSPPGKRKVVQTRTHLPLSTVLIGLALVVALGVLIAQMTKPHKSVRAPVAAVPAPSTALDEPAPATPEPTTASIRTTEHVVYAAPKEQPLTTAQYSPSKPQGMVSERYLAEYKSAAARPKAEPERQYQVAGVFIREVDGRNRYELRYRIFNNRIDISSVCMNFQSDSVEYRECRRAAVPYLREMCSDWSKRAAKDKDDKSRMAQEQYCDAARVYQG